MLEVSSRFVFVLDGLCMSCLECRDVSACLVVHGSPVSWVRVRTCCRGSNLSKSRVREGRFSVVKLRQCMMADSDYYQCGKYFLAS